MVMNPRTHPRGAPPDFALPKPNLNSAYQTDALWWLVCMRMALDPQSRNGGTFANKAGSHNTGNNLLAKPEWRDDHSIQGSRNNTGPWWKTKCAAHDWTFNNAHSGDYSTISKYTKRLINAMADPNDLRPDNVVMYTIGQYDNDRTVEAYSETKDEHFTSSDLSHLFHRHDSFFRNIVGDYWAMWKVLTIDMGWTYTEWQRSIAPVREQEIPVDQKAFNMLMDGWYASTGKKSIGSAVADHMEPNAVTGVPTRLGAYLRFTDHGVNKIISAVAARDDVDESALAGALAPVLAQTIRETLPDADVDITAEELTEAIRNAILSMVSAK